MHNSIERHNSEKVGKRTTLQRGLIYLSRIVKRISGHTVQNHIDLLLMMEAAFLLTRTDYPIARIAESLNFANTASFCKFFNRHKGMSPKGYRKISSIRTRGVVNKLNQNSPYKRMYQA